MLQAKMGELLSEAHLTLSPIFFIIGIPNKEIVMAHHASAIRQGRRSLRRKAVNQKNKSALRTQVKKIKDAVKAKNKEAAEKMLPEAFSLIDQTVKKGSIHENKGARTKSRLSSQVQALKNAPSK